MDATYRGDLRELNELSFARFDAKVSTFEARLHELQMTIETKLEAKLDRAVAEHAFAQLDARIDRTAGELRVQLAEQRADLLKWMFVFWAGTVIPLSGLVVALRIL